jgi:hypothetical protein
MLKKAQLLKKSPTQLNPLRWKSGLAPNKRVAEV